MLFSVQLAEVVFVYAELAALKCVNYIHSAAFDVNSVEVAVVNIFRWNDPFQKLFAV
jgi:hypothetical protein